MSATQKSDCTKSQAVLHMALELSEKGRKTGQVRLREDRQFP